MTRIGDDVVRSSEHLEGGVPFHTIVFAEICLLRAVDFCDGDALLLKCSCSLFVLGCQGLAVSAPGGKD